MNNKKDLEKRLNEISLEIIEKEKEEDISKVKDLILERSEIYFDQGLLEESKKELELALTKVI